MKKVYLDSGATSFPKAPGVAGAVSEYINEIGCNLNRGGYSDTCVLHQVAKETRELVSELFHFPHYKNVIFTQSVTVSLNYILKGIFRAGDHLLISGMEHNAVTRPFTQLKEQGVSFDCIPCDNQGRMDPAVIPALIKPNTRAVVCTHASNVCGTILPIREIGAICKAHGLIFVVDSAQTAGVLPIDMEKDHISILAFTGHKGLMGPPGIGGFVIPNDLAEQMTPMIAGGTGTDSESDEMPTKLPTKFEAGTQNLLGMYGLRVALLYLKKAGIENIHRREMELYEYLLAGLQNIPEVNIYGTQDSKTSTAVISIDVPGYDIGEIAYDLDHTYKITTRCGVQCAPYANRTLGTYPKGTIRFSLGYFNTEDEIDYTLNAIRESCQKFKK